MCVIPILILVAFILLVCVLAYSSNSGGAVLGIKGGGVSKKCSSLLYGIQEHHASRLHWDLRLEKPNSRMSWSWAIPKNIPLQCCKRRLAVEQPDHDVEWLYFQGKTIGSKKFYDGDYGRGDYILWDIGTYDIIKHTKTKFLINIKGKKVKGLYYILKSHDEKRKNHWLIFKKKDQNL